MERQVLQPEWDVLVRIEAEDLTLKDLVGLLTGGLGDS